MSENTALTKTKDTSLRGQLSGDYFKSQIALALPKHMTADRFVRVALTALLKTPKLADCTTESVIECMLNCSALGLEPDGRRAHLIPYGNKCTLIVDYKGIVELAKRSGDVSNVFAQIVCDNDSFTWENGEVKHQIDFRRERGEMYAVYAQITFKDGTRQVDVMTKSEVDAIRKRSKSGNSGPWVTDYNEMAKKTVFRRVSKWVTLSPEVADALEKEEDFTDIKAHVSAPAPEFVPQQKPKKLVAEPVKGPLSPQMEKFNTPGIAKPTTPPRGEDVIVPGVAYVSDDPFAPEPAGNAVAADPVNKPADTSFEAVVDSDSNEISELRAAIQAQGVTEAQVVAFMAKLGHIKKDVSEPTKLEHLAFTKLGPLTKNILAAGNTLKKIKEEV
jgi:recombination protein RecT